MQPCPIVPAQPADLPGILALLQYCDLPSEGMAEHVATAVVARLGDRIVGCSVAEIIPDGAVIHCVAVDPDLRGVGVGHALILNALSVATRSGATEAYLCTSSAARFFPRFGFRRVRWDELPEGVRSSMEAVDVSAASTIVMVRPLVRVADDHPCPPGAPHVPPTVEEADERVAA